jgi:hypothetical protein
VGKYGLVRRTAKCRSGGRRPHGAWGVGGGGKCGRHAVPEQGEPGGGLVRELAMWDGRVGSRGERKRNGPSPNEKCRFGFNKKFQLT